MDSNIYNYQLSFNFRIGCVQGVWMVGVIDEIRMPVTDTSRNPIFVDTKTRVRPTLPSGPQTRNGR